jgi:hypothetical protein
MPADRDRTALRGAQRGTEDRTGREPVYPIDMRPHILPFVAVLLALPACRGEPLPSDKADYAGRWQGDGIDLLITPDGGCAYQKISGGGKTEVNAPIKRFDGDDFIVGVFFIETTFDVTAPPTQTAEGWTMTVDGVQLKRVGS